MAEAAAVGPSEAASGVTLVVKSPAQRHSDLSLPAQRSWSVRRLKAELRRLHPDGPPEDSQRLIYSGKLLPDHLCLRDVLAEHEMVHAIHLVCNSKLVPHVQETDGKVAETKKELETSSQGPSVPPSVHAGSQSENSCNQPFIAGEASNRSHLTTHHLQGMNPGYHSYTTYHMLQFWFQQIYARQYYMQYLAARATSSELPRTPSTQEIPVAPVAAPAPLPGTFPAENQPGNQNAPPQVNPGVNQNLQMNAQGGPLMEEEEEGNRDWLDWLYSATLFYVFVNIIYFYSSMSRLLMVMVGTLLMYLPGFLNARAAAWTPALMQFQEKLIGTNMETITRHRIGWFTFRQRPVHPVQNDIPPQAAVNQDQNNNLQEENVDGHGEIETPELVLENGPPAPSFRSTAWLFFKAFFVSLLPEGPPAVAN